MNKKPVEVSIEVLHFGAKRDQGTIRSNPNLIAGETEGQNCETRSLRKSWVQAVEGMVWVRI